MNNLKNIVFDIAKNHAQEEEYIIIYKQKDKYFAISVASNLGTCISKCLGEYSHIVQVPTSWALLSYNWESEIQNNHLVHEIWSQINAL